MSVLRPTALGLLLLPAVALAQPAAVKQAAESITEAQVRRLVELIAHDSMGGRDTPSPGLERTATWIAGEFRRLGLEPGGDAGDFVQRYPINVAEPDPDSTFLELRSTGGLGFRLQLGREVVLLGRAPEQLTRMPVLLLGGALDSAALRPADVEGRLVVWTASPVGESTRQLRAQLGLLGRLGAAGVVAVLDGEAGARLGGAGLDPVVRLGAPPPAGAPSRGRLVGLVSQAAIVRHVPEAEAEFARLRAAPSMVAQPLPDWEAAVVARLSPPRPMGAPNVAGILEGSDPALRGEYVVISAHMDHVGSRCRGVSAADAICNGADDDASGTAGVLALAEALARPGARPARSVIFLAVSGEERGLWGSQHFAANAPVDLAAVVANLNMDMIGRNWADTIVAIGKGHSDLGATADRVAAAHPELGLTVVDDLWPAEGLYGRSDHINFARRGVPVLFFTSGLHDDYHAVSDSPDKIDAEKEARILRLVFYLTREIGNRAERPRWKPESYDAIVGSGRRP